MDIALRIDTGERGNCQEGAQAKGVRMETIGELSRRVIKRLKEARRRVRKPDPHRLAPRHYRYPRK